MLLFSRITFCTLIVLISCSDEIELDPIVQNDAHIMTEVVDSGNPYDLLYADLIEEREIERIYEEQEHLNKNIINFATWKSQVSRIDFDVYEENYLNKAQSIFNSFSDQLHVISESRDSFYNENPIILRFDSAYFHIAYPVMNAERTYAIVDIDYSCGYYCSYSELSIYRKVNGKWTLDRIIRRSES
ncbi:MAG: hypothetical protein GQ574_22150 [Crocinitomix sp.]|nr:hypothetical protein [Crocinitomix sp.]